MYIYIYKYVFSSVCTCRQKRVRVVFGRRVQQQCGVGALTRVHTFKWMEAFPFKGSRGGTPYR